MPTHVYNRHPAIAKAFPYTSDSLSTAEDPCLSEDGIRVAYFRSDEHRSIDRRTVCPLHRYLVRNLGLSEARATKINDAWNKEVARRQADTSTCSFVEGAEMVRPMCLDSSLIHCPSCMNGDWDADNHPYRAYSPKHGWRLAVRTMEDEDGQTHLMARALVNGSEHGRIYGPVEDHTGPSAYATDGDAALEAFLADNGIVPSKTLFLGCTLSYMETPGGNYCAPYVDHKIPSHGVEVRTRGLRFDRDCMTIAIDGWREAGGYVELVECYDGSMLPASDCVQLRNGEYATQSECTKLWDGDWCLDYDAVEDHHGRVHYRDDCVRLHDGSWCNSLDSQLCTLHDGEYALVDAVVRLFDGEWALEGDAYYWESDDEYHLEPEPEDEEEIEEVTNA